MCVHHLLRWFVFFFVNQKTAYEMRISDWSPDVCSSDLESRDSGFGVRKSKSIARERAPTKGLRRGPAELLHRGTLHRADLRAVADLQHHQIGRASCRGRVCQYG